jgi:cytochrome c oxidase cbb3-type subunit I/II
MLSVKSVNWLAHYTDWIIAHVHTGALGWNGFLTFGMIYWLLPRVFQTKLHSTKLAEAHFWFATLGMVLYAVAIYSAGLTQGLMWRAFDDTGRLQFPDFIETTVRLIPFYALRALGGGLYIVGMVLFGWNILKTWQARPRVYVESVHQAAALDPAYPRTTSIGAPWWRRFAAARWHRRWEGLPLTFTVWTAIAVLVASLFEVLPTFLIRSNVPTIAAVHPYTPLELTGRDIYIREGCFNCHSQMVRPFRHETERYGDYSKPGEFVYDHPFLWGSRRIGPDLAREGGKYPDLWHVRHMENPSAITARSIMPAYPALMRDRIDFAGIQRRVDAMAMLGVPYGDAVRRAPDMARAQAQTIAAGLVEQGGPSGLADKEIVALVAYLQRLGRDATTVPRVAQAQAAGGAR